MGTLDIGTMYVLTTFPLGDVGEQAVQVDSSLQGRGVLRQPQVKQQRLEKQTTFLIYRALDVGRVAKFDPKVGSRTTTEIKNLVVLVIILVVLIVLPHYMYVVLVLAVFVGKRKITVLKDLLG